MDTLLFVAAFGLPLLSVAGGYFLAPRLVSRERFQSFHRKLEDAELVRRDGLFRPFVPFFDWLGVTPNSVTLAGIFLTLLIFSSLLGGRSVTGLFPLALAAAISDMLDGSLARLTNRVTALGGFLDGLRDLALSAVLLGGLIREDRFPLVPFIFFLAGSLVVGAIKVVEVLGRSRRRIFAAFQERFRGRGKIALDRPKAFFFFVSMLAFILEPSGTFFGAAGTISLNLSLIFLALAAVIHGASLRFPLD